MTISKYNEIFEAVNAVRKLTESGIRMQEYKAHEDMECYVMRLANKRCKNSVYMVYRKAYNYGTHHYNDRHYLLNVTEIESCKDTEKSFVTPDGERIPKKNIIGWLS